MNPTDVMLWGTDLERRHPWWRRAWESVLEAIVWGLVR